MNESLRQALQCQREASAKINDIYQDAIDALKVFHKKKINELESFYKKGLQDVHKKNKEISSRVALIQEEARNEAVEKAVTKVRKTIDKKYATSHISKRQSKKRVDSLKKRVDSLILEVESLKKSTKTMELFILS